MQTAKCDPMELKFKIAFYFKKSPGGWELCPQIPKASSGWGYIPRPLSVIRLSDISLLTRLSS